MRGHRWLAIWTTGVLLTSVVGCRGLTTMNTADVGQDVEPTAPLSLQAEVIAVFPHDPAAFTQGLLWSDGHLIEGTGLEGHSSLRRVELDSGHVIESVDLDDHLFGEGVALVGDRIYQLTWKAGQALVYDADTFEWQHTFAYDTEGWGLATDGQRLVMSDGTDVIRFRDPSTFEVTGELHVRDGDRPVTELNELEIIDGEIYANVWKTHTIARISLDTGQVLAWIDLSNLSGGHNAGRDVLNGIAWDPQDRRLFVTGKLWSELYEIRLTASGR